VRASQDRQIAFRNSSGRALNRSKVSGFSRVCAVRDALSVMKLANGMRGSPVLSTWEYAPSRGGWKNIEQSFRASQLHRFRAS